MADRFRGHTGLLGEIYQPNRLALLPGHPDVALVVIYGDGTRFGELFRRTWRRLPVGSRRLICGHWRQDPPGIGSGADVVLLHGWPGREEQDLAWVDLSGHRLQFHWPSVSEMPDDVLQVLIAHELAHVVQFAWNYRKLASEAGLRSNRDDDDDLFDDRAHWERDADHRIIQWGFDVEALEEWESQSA